MMRVFPTCAGVTVWLFEIISGKGHGSLSQKQKTKNPTMLPWPQPSI
jgi:hypothetical protein